jgi:hypothetical protein
VKGEVELNHYGEEGGFMPIRRFFTVALFQWGIQGGLEGDGPSVKTDCLGFEVGERRAFQAWSR